MYSTPAVDRHISILHKTLPREPLLTQHPNSQCHYLTYQAMLNRILRDICFGFPCVEMEASPLSSALFITSHLPHPLSLGVSVAVSLASSDTDVIQLHKEETH